MNATLKIPRIAISILSPVISLNILRISLPPIITSIIYTVSYFVPISYEILEEPTHITNYVALCVVALLFICGGVYGVITAKRTPSDSLLPAFFYFTGFIISLLYISIDLTHLSFIPIIGVLGASFYLYLATNKSNHLEI